MKTFLSILLFSILITFVKSQSYTVTPIKSTSGIFYQNLGQTKIYYDHFTILTYFNISFYEQKLWLLDNTFSKTKNLCNIINTMPSYNFHCSKSLSLIEVQVPQLHTKFDTITHLTGHVKRQYRKRRGLINGLSTAFKWLIGTPDANDAEYYSKSINALVQKNRETQILMQQQIHIMNSAITNYNYSTQSLKAQEAKFNKNIILFNEFSLNATNKINQILSIELITDHVNLLSQLSSELNEELDVIISSILFAKQNVLHPIIINPKELQKELSTVKLNSNFEFPIPLDLNSIHKLLTVCKIFVIFDNQNLIYSIKIPMTKTQNFNLYKLIPLPTHANDSSIFSYIDPHNPFLLLSVTKTHYSLLKDLSTCKEMDAGEYLCENPTIYLTAQRPVCEVELRIQQSMMIPDDCLTKIVKADMEIWHPLKPNQWLYVLSKPITATISCRSSGTDFIDVILKNSGILELKSKCHCYTMSATLYATSNDSTNFTHYMPNININDDDCCSKNIEYLRKSEMEPIQLNNINLDELRYAKHKLEEFEETLQSEINKPFLNGHSSFFNTLLAVITVSALSLLFCCFCCINCCDCTWIPFIGKFIPHKTRSLFEYCKNSKNSINHSVVYLPPNIELKDFENFSRNNAIVPINNRLNVTPLTTGTSAIETSDEEEPVVQNPYALKLRPMQKFFKTK